MNKNIFKFALVAMTAGVLAFSCTKEKDNDSAIQKPVMVSISADPYFTGSSAEVKATLTQAIETPVTVTLEAGTQLAQDYTTVIETSLISAGTITIPAGATEATAIVTVDNSELPKGKYETQIVASGAKGANMSSSNSANIILLQGVSTASLAFNANFTDDGTTTFTVSLDMYSEEDCVVSIAQYNLPNYTNVPAMAYSFDKEITIKAGEKSATGSVQIDLDGLYDSAMYVGGLQITGVKSETEGKFEVSATSYRKALAFYFTAPKKNKTWGIEYLGQFEIEGNVREVFYVDGVADDAYVDYFITAKDVEETNSYIYPNIIAAEDNYLASYIKAGYTLDQLCLKGSGYLDAKKRAAGTYKLWVVAVAADGSCTGEYATKEFTVAPEPEATEAYSAWLGDWTIGSTAEDEKPVVITISKKDVNSTYYIDGLEGVNTVGYQISAVAQLEEDGSMSIYGQEFGTWTSDYGEATDILAGQIVQEGSTYFVGGSYLITNITLSSNGEAVMSAGRVELSDGTLYALVGMKYYWRVSAGAGSYSKVNTPLPNTLIPVEPTPNPEGVKRVGVKNVRREGATLDKSNLRGLTGHIFIK